MDLLDLPYPHKRVPLVAGRGVVATSEPLAAQAGLFVLAEGGTAVDAAIATAAALTVLEPTSNGLGADAFSLVWDGSALHGIDGSGHSPAALSAERIRAAGLKEIPKLGWLPVTVPGAVAAWRDLHARFGRLPFERLLAPAIRYAEDGFPVGPVTADGWARGHKVYLASAKGPEFRGWFETFAPGGRPPRAGEIFRSPGHAATLRAIATSKGAAFYEGDVAAAIDRFARETGGLLTRDDLAAHKSAFVTPIRAGYRGYEVAEIPPANQGLSALAALRILDGFDLARLPRDGVESIHLQIEALKLAMTDVARFVGDRDVNPDVSRGLLDDGYVAQRRLLIGEKAMLPAPGSPPKGGTVYLCVADADGRMVSFIQSNYAGFGSGIVIPGTGIALQDRGACFTLEAGHPNEAGPKKRPFHTIMPGFLLKDAKPVGPFGVMGGSMQPQGHVQVLVRELDQALNIQAALDAPRFQWLAERKVAVEPGFPAETLDALRARGHELETKPADGFFGRGQTIRRLLSGAYVAATDFRADGGLAGY
jgi:gamma-glutamyltranspeptidase / glutathione hydrolase